MKKFTCIFLAVLMVLTSIRIVSARETEPEISKDAITINGLQYDDLPYATSEMDQGLKSQLFINNLDVNSNILELKGVVVEANGEKKPIDIKGKIYKPVITGFGSDRAVIFVTENNSIYEVIHFSIELHANKTMLLRSDRDSLENKPIIKLYLKENDTRKVHFFEDEFLPHDNVKISSILSNRIVIKETRGKNNKELQKFSDEELKLENSIIGIDFWLSRLFNNAKNSSSINISSPMNAVTSAEYASSPNFKIAGQQFGYFYSGNEPVGGWFKDSYQYPAGSSNILSYYIKFFIVTHTPQTNPGRAVISVSLEEVNTRQYLAPTDETKFIDTQKADLAIGSLYKSPKLSAQTYTPNGDFFISEYIQFGGSVSQLDRTNWLNKAKVIVSYVPKLNTVCDAVSNLVEYVGAGYNSTIVLGDTKHFFDTYDKQMMYYKTGLIRAAGTSFETKSLRLTGSSLSVEGTVVKINPGVVSAKQMYYDAEIPICTSYGNGSNYYSTIDFCFFRDYTY